MKRIIAILLTVICLFSCYGCCTEARPTTDGQNAGNISTTPSDILTNDHSADEETTEAPETAIPLYKGSRETSNLLDCYGTKETFPPETVIIPDQSQGSVAADEPFDANKYYPTVLMYHCVNDEPYTVNTALFVRPSHLEEHLMLLEELDYECLFADEFGPRNEKSVILTFDDGYEDNYTYMFPLIKKYNVKVTVFMIGYKIDKPGYLSSEQIREMSDSGLVQFGSHTLDHPNLSGLTEEGLREQFSGTNLLISEITGKPVTTVAYPSGDYNETVMDIAAEYYDFAYTTDADSYFGQDRMMLPRYAILRDMDRNAFRVFID